MFAWFAVSLVWSWDRLYTLQYLGYIACGGGLAMLIAKYIGTNLERFLQLFEAAKWAFAIDITAGLLEVFTDFRLPVSPFSTRSEQQVLDGFSSEAMVLVSCMPTGFHWNPNNFAMVMCLLFPFFLVQRNLIAGLAGVVTIVALVYFADSRAALVALAFISMLLPVFRGKSVWLFSAIGFIAAVQFCFLTHGKLSRVMDSEFVHALARYSGSEDWNELDSVGVRRHLIENGFTALSQTYGLGVGGGADKAVQEKMYALPTTEIITSMHHTWLELLVNGGVPFFACFVGWYVALIWELLGHAKRWPIESRVGYFSRCLSLSLLGLVPAAVAASTAVYVLPMYVVFGMSMAMVNICRYRQAAPAPDSTFVRSLSPVRRKGVIAQ
jgi:hypothetical protein